MKKWFDIAITVLLLCIIIIMYNNIYYFFIYLFGLIDVTLFSLHVHCVNYSLRNDRRTPIQLLIDIS